MSPLIEKLRQIRVHPTLFFTSGRISDPKRPDYGEIESSPAPKGYVTTVTGSLRRFAARGHARKRNLHKSTPGSKRMSGKQWRRIIINTRAFNRKLRHNAPAQAQ